ARIQGTNLRLDTPEEISAWIEERRRKWPTRANIAQREEREAKRRAYEEASPSNVALLHQDGAARGRGRGRGRGDRGRERGRGRGQSRLSQGGFQSGSGTRERDVGWGSRPINHAGAGLPKRPTTGSGTTSEHAGRGEGSASDQEDEEAVARQLLSTNANATVETGLQQDEAEDDVDGESIEASTRDVSDDDLPDEEPVGRPESDEVENTMGAEHDDMQEDDMPHDDVYPTSIDKSSRPCRSWTTTGHCKFGKKCMYAHDPSTKPKKQPFAMNAQDAANPFARDDLIGKLLFNEVRHDVSDLRQVIDFLARNEWLEGVELYPGHLQEVENRIKIVS
ncbi:hypothetical protein EMMF5_002191, partial [Cystobasidiomycetes sp. EMM_F5]